MTNDHHHRTVRVHLLGHTEKVDAVIGDQICEIVLKMIANTMNKYKIIRCCKALYRGVIVKVELKKNTKQHKLS